MKKTTPFFLAILTVVLLGVSAAYARDLAITTSAALGLGIENQNNHANVKASTSVTADPDMTVDAKTKDHATAEIDRRTSALAKLQSKVAAMKRISADNKASLTANLDTQISVLNTLKSKISADTDKSAVKADVASITKNYRIFMTVMPQGVIMATADKINATADLMTDFGAKLQTRITTAKDDGHDVAPMETAYADYTAKIKDATVQANAAIDLTANLKPDNGDKTIADANKKALTDARVKIRAGESDLRTARQDALTIIKGLKGFTATTSVSADSSNE